MTAAEHVVQLEELMAYLDGELSAERATAIQTHVTSCAACQQAAEDLRSVSRNLSAWQVEDPPSTFTAPEILAAPPAARVRPFFQLLTSRRAVAIELVAGVAALVIVGISWRPMEQRAFFVPDQVPRAAEPPAATAFGRARGVAAQEQAVAKQSAPVEAPSQVPRGPQIVRTATIRIVTDQFETVRPAVERILTEMGGFVGQVDVTGSRGAPRSLRATLRIPAARLDAMLTELKKLGHVVAESLGGDDVTEQIVDLEARLTNHRNTEKRLIELLQKRTGDLAGVLAAEREIARVREEIERLDAQRKNLEQRVSYATLTLELLEERKAELDLGTTSVAARFRNALVDGVLGAADSLLAFALFAIRVAPFLVLWALVLGLPAWFVLRWRRRANA